MNDGFVKVAAGSVATTVADVVANVQEIKARITEADAAGVNLLVLPELCITGYTCGDLFFSQRLQSSARAALTELRQFTAGKFPVVLVGLPFLLDGKLYNCAAVLHNGRILGLVPKIHIPNYGEFYEKRQFTSGAPFAAHPQTVEIDGVTYPMYKLDTSSASHPFYTGAQTRIVEAGRVEKFRAKFAAKQQAMNAAAEASGKVFGIMWNQRTTPIFRRAREIVQSGALGQPKRLVWTITNWYRSQAYYESGGWRATWAGEGGGVLLNQAPHNLDLWQWIFGLPDRIRAFCTNGKYHNIEVEDDATIYAEYKNGATAVFITSTGEYPGTNRLEISGDRGKLVLENGKLHFWKLETPEREACFTEKAGFPHWPMTEEVYEPNDNGPAHRGILQNFSDAIRLGTPLLAPGAEGIRELSISNAAYLSAWTNDWVSLPVDDAAFDAQLNARIAGSKGERVAPADSEKPTGTYSERWSVRW